MTRAGLSQLDLDVDASRQIELHQRVHGLRRRLHDIEQPLVGPDLELLARLLVDVRRAVDGELLNSRRQRNGTADQRTGAPRSISDVAGRLIEHTVIEGFQANTDILRFHVPTDAKEPVRHHPKGGSGPQTKNGHARRLAFRPRPPRPTLNATSKASRANLRRPARLAPYITS